MTEHALPFRVDVSLHAGSESAIAEAVIEAVKWAVLERLEDTLEVTVKRVVQEQATAFIRERLAPVVNEALAAGWQKTDEYGRPKGENVTVKSLVLDLLSDRRESYGTAKAWVSQQVEQYMGSVLKKEVDEVRAAFRKGIDDELAARVRKVMAEALGVRT